MKRSILSNMNLENYKQTTELSSCDIEDNIETIQSKLVDITNHIYLILFLIPITFYIGLSYFIAVCLFETIMLMYFIYTKQRLKYLELKLNFSNKNK